MPDIRILSENELRDHVKLDLDVIDCVEQALGALARDDVQMPPILHMSIPENNGEVDAKTAYIPGMDSFALKVSPGFFDNPKLGLPSTNGLMILFNSRTGIVEALLLDNGYLTDVRTAAAGSVAAKYLAREDAKTVGILGGGMQARLQLKALTLVRPIEKALLWARRQDQAQHVAKELSQEHGIPVAAVATPQDAIAGQDILVTATPSTEPLVQAEWLSPGQHITAMGSDAAYKNELSPAVLKRADVYLCDRQSQCEVLGELHHALEAGIFDRDATFPEIGQVIAGAASGRTSPAQITVADLTGTGVQDTGIATFAAKRCAAANVGSSFSS